MNDFGTPYKIKDGKGNPRTPQIIQLMDYKPYDPNASLSDGGNKEKESSEDENVISENMGETASGQDPANDNDGMVAGDQG